MSRTDRHRPYWVQQADRYEQRFYLFYSGAHDGWRKIFLYRDCNCSVWWCSMTEPNRHERRRDRHQARRACRQALKER